MPFVAADPIKPVSWINGGKPAKTINYHLLSENGSYILTEDGKKIIIAYGYPPNISIGDGISPISWLPGDMV